MLTLYRWLLRAFPRSFRDRFGADMTDVFADRLRAARSRGRVAVAGFLVETVVDVIGHGLSERHAVRRARRESFLSTVRQDLRFARRLFTKRPGVAGAAVLTLALGIGVNVAVFSAVRAALLDRLPYADPDRLVSVTEATPRERDLPLDVPDFEAVRDRTPAFSTTAACAIEWGLAVKGRGEAALVNGSRVSPDFFRVFGVAPLLGRALDAGDFVPGVRSVVISSSLWQAQFGGDPQVIGRPFSINREVWTVVGVMPPSFEACTGVVSGSSSDEISRTLWRPLTSTTVNRNLFVFARLARGASIPIAKAQVNTVLADRSAGSSADGVTTGGGDVSQLGAKDASAVRPGLLLLQSVAGFILLITCANVANLFLALAATRGQELVVRASLGASRWRLARQLLTEAAAVAACGVALGVALALLVVPILVPANTLLLPLGVRATIRAPELAMGVALGWLTALVFGTVPALFASRSDARASLARGTRSTVHPAARAFRSGLVAAEVLLAVVVLTGAGLFVKSFARLVTVPMGFDTRNLIVADLSAFGGGNSTEHERLAFVRRLDDALRGTVSDPFTVTNWMPGMPMPIDVIAMAPDDGSAPDVRFQQLRAVSPGAFEMLRLPIIRGRSFTPADTGGAEPVAIVNEAFARQFGSGRDVIGRRLLRGRPATEYTIVGVVADVRTAPTQPPPPAVYVPFDQVAPYGLAIVVRTVNPLAAAAAIRAAVRAIDPDVPVHVAPIAAALRGDAARRYYLTMLSLFAGLAAALAAIGIYAVVAHVTALRTRELGIRLALGATPGAIKGLVVRQGLRPVLAGIAGGVGAAWWIADLLQANAAFRSQLFEVTPHDPWTFAATAFGLFAIAVLACWLPTRRTSRVDPASVLRAE